MNIEEQLLKAHSKENTKKITDYIGNDKERLHALMECFFSNTYRVTQRSAMAVSDYFDRHPEMMKDYKVKMIENLKKNDLHIAIKRNTLRLLQFTTIPEPQEATLFDICIKFLSNDKEAIAVKAFSTTILYNLCKKYPELITEFRPVLEQTFMRSSSAGVKNRAGKVLKLLDKLK